MAAISGLITATLIVTIVLSLFMQYVPKSTMVYAAGTPDSYGNQIDYVRIFQGGQQVYTITYSNYTSGMTIDIDANVITYLTIEVSLNETLVVGNPQDFSRVYLNVSTIYTNLLVPSTGYSGPVAGFYSVTFGSSTTTEWTTGTDITYECSVRYEAYY